MNVRFLPFSWMACLLLASSAPAREDVSEATARRALEKTRLELRRHGFKTDVADFDFSFPPQLRDRETIRASAITNQRVAPFHNHPDVMESAATNKAIVIWQQRALIRPVLSEPDIPHELSWDDFRDWIKRRQPQLDAACAAILAGPIQFDLAASDGDAMRLPHLPFLKELTQTLDERSLLALHDGWRDAAWTNLLAATRLVTAWNPEPAEVSHRLRFDDAKWVSHALWQALQTNGWPDRQLAALQHEWESADFLSRLPEIPAFQSAGDAQMLEDDKAAQKKRAELWEDETSLLLFYRDRQVEFRNAVRAVSWLSMRALPGVTNEPCFIPEHHSLGLFEFNMVSRRARTQARDRAVGFLARAAQAEAERRIIITALALERFRVKFGNYPETVQALAPDFLPSPPIDFMNGQPLRYWLNEDGHFLLYSVGLDCVDNGGRMESPSAEGDRISTLTNPNASRPESDVVWPLPASSADITVLRVAQAEGKAQADAHQNTVAQARHERARIARAAAMKQRLAEKPALGPEPVYHDTPLSVWAIGLSQIEELDGAPEDPAEAIRFIGANAVPFLLEWMTHPETRRQVEDYPDGTSIVLAWSALGTNGKSAIPELARRLNRPEQTADDESFWSESAAALSLLGTDAIGPMLAAATNMQGKHFLGELLCDFANLGTYGAPAVPTLIQWVNHPDDSVRDGVVTALGGIGKHPDLAVPVLMHALKHDTNGIVRRDAATALGAFANDSRAALPTLRKLLKDPDWQVRQGALSGLGKIRNKPDVVVPLIAPFLYEQNNVLQRSAAYALRDLGSPAGYRVLLQASNAPSSWPGISDIIYQVQAKMRHAQSP